MHERTIPDQQGGLAYGPGVPGRIEGEPAPELNYGAIRVPGPRSAIQEQPPAQPPREEPRAPVSLASYAPRIGSPEASRLSARLGLPEFSLSPTVDTTPGGLYRAGERATPSQDAVQYTTQDYLKMYPDAVSARVARDRDPGNVALRNAEHYRVAEEIMGKIGPLPTAVATVGYTALKMLGAGMPHTARALLQGAGVNLPQGTTNPGEELYWGLKGSMPSSNPFPITEKEFRGR